MSIDSARLVSRPDVVDGVGRRGDADATAAFLFVGGDAPSDSTSDRSALDDVRLTSIRALVARFGGRELDATVDSFPAVFASPSSALRCARAILIDSGTLRVGLHCGEPLAIEIGRYFGAAVWTAARLCGRADPGQILVSGVARDLLQPDGRDGLSSAGAVRLKGVAEPVVVYTASTVDPDPDTDTADEAAAERIITVLAVDQVGSTAILDVRGDLAARTVHEALMDVLREAIEEHGGVELEYGGDGLGVRFDSVLAAVSCATTMQEAAARHRRRFPDAELFLRGAVVSGEIDRSRPSSFARLLVESARILKRAGTDDVLVSITSWRLAADRRVHRFSPLTNDSVMRLEWRRTDRETTLPVPLAAHGVLIGRNHDLDRLTADWTSAVEQRRQVFVAVDGESGIGKTALAARFARAVVEGAHRPIVLYGRCVEVETRPLEALVDAVSGVVARASRADLRRLLGPGAAAIADLLPVVANRLPEAAVGAGGSRPRVRDWAESIDLLLTGLADEAPVLLVLDDLQNASDEMVAAIRVIGEHADPRALVLLGLRRGAADAGALLRDIAAQSGRVETRTITGLTPAETGELVAEITGTSVPDEVSLAIHAESSGVPAVAIRLARIRSEATAREQVHRSYATMRESGEPDPAQLRALAAGVLRLNLIGERAAGETSERLAGDVDGIPALAAANPYLGLARFEAEDAGRFFGREQLTADLVARVASARMCAVIGASGSGKSSLVRAGLLPALINDALPGSRDWPIAVMVPGGRPAAALAEAIADITGKDRDFIDAELQRNGLGAVARSVMSVGARLVIVVDQAEELFTSSSEGARDRFVELLEGAAEPHSSADVVVVYVVRADFYGFWSAYPRTAELLERNQVLLRSMTDREIRRAIEAPAAGCGLVVEAGLLDTVLADVAGEPGALPLLSTALSQTWQHRRGRTLTLRGYAETGGARGAVARLADEVYESHSEQQRGVARGIFLRLAQVGGSEAALDLRRRAPIEEIVDLDPGAAAVLRTLVDDRLVIADDTSVEVAHEALLREWPRLRGWLDEDRAGRALEQQLAVDTRVWRRANRDESLLYRGSRLALAAEYIDAHPTALSPPEREYIAVAQASASSELRHTRRSVARFRRLAVGLVMVLVLALVAGGLAIVSGNAAAARALDARSAALTAQADGLDDSQQDLAALLALSADRVHPSGTTKASLATATNRSPELLRTIPLGTAADRALEISRDGSTAVVIRQDGAVRAFRLPSGRVIGSIVVHGDIEQMGASLSPTGRYLVAWYDGRVTMLDTATGQRTKLRTANTPEFLADDLLTYSDDDGKTAFIDRTGRSLRITGPVDGGVVADSDDGQVRAWGDLDTSTTTVGNSTAYTDTGRSVTHVANGPAGKEQRTVPGLFVAMSPDGGRLAVLDGSTVEIVDVATRRTLRTFPVGASMKDDLVLLNAPMSTAEFDRTGGLLMYTGSDTGQPLHLLDISTGLQRVIPFPLAHGNGAPRFDGDGHVLVLTVNGVAEFSIAPTVVAAAFGSRTPRNEVSPTPRALVAVDVVHSHVLAEIEPGAPAQTSRYRIGSASAPTIGPVLTPGAGRRFDQSTAAFSGDGRRLATVEASIQPSGTSLISVWDVASGRRIGVTGSFPMLPPKDYGGDLVRLSFIAGTDQIAVVQVSVGSATDGEFLASLEVWRLGALTPTVNEPLGYAALAAFSPDGRTLATLGEQTLTLLSTSTGQTRSAGPEPAAGQSDYATLTFSTDGRYVTAGASGGDDAVVRWEAATPSRYRRYAMADVVDGREWAVSPDASVFAEVGRRGVEFRRFSDGAVVEESDSSAAIVAVLGFTSSGNAVVGWDGTRLFLIDRSGRSVPLGQPLNPIASSVVPDDPQVVAAKSSIISSVISGAAIVTQSFVTDPVAMASRACEIAGRGLTPSEWSHYLPDVSFRALCPS